MTRLRWYRCLELHSRWCRQQYSHFDTAFQRPKGKLYFSFAIMMSTSSGCAPRYFRHLPAMSIKTTLHTTALLLYPCHRYPKCPWGLYASPPPVAMASIGLSLYPPPRTPFLFKGVFVPYTTYVEKKYQPAHWLGLFAKAPSNVAEFGVQNCSELTPPLFPLGRFRAEDKFTSGPHVGRLATSPLPFGGSIPNASQRWTKSEVAHKWAWRLHHPFCLGGPQRFRGGKQNQKWPTCRPCGYINPAVRGVPNALEQQMKSEVAQQKGLVTASPMPFGETQRFRAGDKIRSSPQLGMVATSPLPFGGSPLLHGGKRNQKWPKCG